MHLWLAMKGCTDRGWLRLGHHIHCLTHWGRVTHICVGKLTIIGSDNGLSPARRQAIICTNARILLIGPLGTNFSAILIEICIFSFMKIYLKMSSGRWRPFCLGLNVLTPRPCPNFSGNLVELISNRMHGYNHLYKPLSEVVSVTKVQIEPFCTLLTCTW